MLRLPAAVRRLITSWSMGQAVPQHQAREAAAHFESGHVCRNCESHLVRLPGGEYQWCPTCGAETHGQVSDICMCGARVGKHDAQLRCSPAAQWADESNPLLRRKVTVVAKPDPIPKPAVPRSSGAALFDDDEGETS